MANTTGISIDDGVIRWFDGPEWDDVVQEVFEREAPGITAAAQADAPWEDRTGQARHLLNTKVDRASGEIILTLYHGVEYGKWLETIQSGNFAVIMPTLERLGPKVIKEAEAAVAKARRGR